MKKRACLNNHSRIIGSRVVALKIFVLLTAFALMLCGLPQATFAIGTFVQAPERVDMVYDNARDILYITNGETILRYKIGSNSFLSPFTIGGQLKGIDLSPDGNMLVVADQSYTDSEVWVHQINLLTEEHIKVTFPRAFYEGGTFTVAFGADGAVLITSTFLGSGWVPLRKYDPATGSVIELTTVTQKTMLRASADGSVIGFAESNSSDGPFGRYRVNDGSILRKQGYTDGTSWFNYEIAVNRNGSQYAIPTYGGTFITDGNLVKYATIGQYAGGQPIGVVYHPTKDIIYFAWATTTQVYAYDSLTLTKIDAYDFENAFDHPGNNAFVEGRMKIASDGTFLFATVEGGIRFVKLNTRPVADSQSLTTAEDSAIGITLTGFDEESDPLTYIMVEGPVHGTLSGIAPNLTYTPAADYNGVDQFSFKVNDGAAESLPATVSISISTVNDQPSFNLAGANLSVKKNSAQTVPQWAANVIAGPYDEAAQTVTFVVTTDKPELFSRQPTIDTSGTLTFTVRNHKGMAAVTVLGRDNGGTENGGIDQSEAQSFTISIL